MIHYHVQGSFVVLPAERFEEIFSEEERERYILLEWRDTLKYILPDTWLVLQSRMITVID